MADLNQEIFGLEVTNHELIKTAYDAYLANSRSSHAKTLTRSEVRGGGKKPWKQKGTGRARFGSTRNPIWRHGGIAGGRTGLENFTKTIAKGAKKVAVRQALSLKHADQAVVVIDSLGVKAGKTKEVIKTLSDHQIEGNTLLVVKDKDELTLRATRNIANVKIVRPTYINVYDTMNADRVVIVKDALPEIETWLIGKENA